MNVNEALFELKDVIDRLIDDLNPDEMVLVIELIVKELSNILKIYDKIFK